MMLGRGLEHRRRGSASSLFTRRAVLGRVVSGLAALALALLLPVPGPAPAAHPTAPSAAHPTVSPDAWSGEWKFSVEETAKLHPDKDKEAVRRLAADPEIADSFAVITAVPGRDAFTFVLYIADGKGGFVEKPGGFSAETTAEDGLLRGRVRFGDNPEELVLLVRVLREGSLIGLTPEGYNIPPYVFVKR